MSCYTEKPGGGGWIKKQMLLRRDTRHIRVNILLFQSLQFPEGKRMFGLGSHVCCLRNYKYTPRHFQVKGQGNANTASRGDKSMGR